MTANESPVGSGPAPVPSADGDGIAQEGEGKLALVCMAEADEARLVADDLRRADYDARVVDAGDLMDACAGQPRPAALILDGEIPALKDFTLLKQLRSLNDFGKVLVVYCHRRVDIGYVLQAMDAGAGVFLFKPIETLRLLRHLRERT